MTSVYFQVNDRILEALERAIIPWKRPWTGRLPTNYDSGKEYHGVNILTLGIVELTMGYSSRHQKLFWLIGDLLFVIAGNAIQDRPGEMNLAILPGGSNNDDSTAF